MILQKFKTNINCSNCIKAVQNTLDEIVGEEKWQIDTTNPDKVLTLVEDTDPDLVYKNLNKIGFEAFLIKD